eukprot:Skav204423  [mRNA]  locus=scaffold398:724685:724924:- [translate_table: standard]
MHRLCGTSRQANIIKLPNISASLPQLKAQRGDEMQWAADGCLVVTGMDRLDRTLMFLQRSLESLLVAAGDMFVLEWLEL